MPKKSNVANATSQTQSQTFTAEQAIKRHTDTAPMFGGVVQLLPSAINSTMLKTAPMFGGVVQPSKWYGRDLEPLPVFTMGKAVAL